MTETGTFLGNLKEQMKEFDPSAPENVLSLIEEYKKDFTQRITGGRYTNYDVIMKIRQNGKRLRRDVIYQRKSVPKHEWYKMRGPLREWIYGMGHNGDKNFQNILKISSLFSLCAIYCKKNGIDRDVFGQVMKRFEHCSPFYKRRCEPIVRNEELLDGSNFSLKSGLFFITLPSGSFYYGHLLYNVRYGKGLYFNIEQGYFYLGSYKNDKFHGEGHFEFLVDSISNSEETKTQEQTKSIYDRTIIRKELLQKTIYCGDWQNGILKTPSSSQKNQLKKNVEVRQLNFHHEDFWKRGRTYFRPHNNKPSLGSFRITPDLVLRCIEQEYYAELDFLLSSPIPRSNVVGAFSRSMRLGNIAGHSVLPDEDEEVFVCGDIDCAKYCDDNVFQNTLLNGNKKLLSLFLRQEEFCPSQKSGFNCRFRKKPGSFLRQFSFSHETSMLWKLIKMLKKEENEKEEERELEKRKEEMIRMLCCDSRIDLEDGLSHQITSMGCCEGDITTRLSHLHISIRMRRYDVAYTIFQHGCKVVDYDLSIDRKVLRRMEIFFARGNKDNDMKKKEEGREVLNERQKKWKERLKKCFDAVKEGWTVHSHMRFPKRFRRCVMLVLLISTRVKFIPWEVIQYNILPFIPYHLRWCGEWDKK